MSESGEPGSRRGLVQDARGVREHPVSHSQAGRRGRTHNAEGAREAILNAAETVFAEHGFDGARVDAIAAESGYNKSLIFQYFGDKLGLYTEVNRRIDRELNALSTAAVAPLLADEKVASDPQRFKALLEAVISVVFDAFLKRPRVMRIILWEQAEGWQTYKKIMSQLDTEDVDQLRTFFAKARDAGLLRSDFDPFIQIVMAEAFCWSYLSSIPLYQMFTDENLSSEAALARGRAYLIDFIVHGMMVDSKDNKD
ncbi:MAG TPA: TetR/AcrR family transcriptional regulator [Ktedonobacteraceae bacterium]|jgi:TetR/AcrR family transcriptional regulator|nr:TetR/AcrR family transcriptional regulator [Ktedonobacteraceae bacterium]